jgi:hypothetical protein
VTLEARQITPWPQAVAGVVRPARVPTTPRWRVPALPLLVQGREFCRPLMSLCLNIVLLLCLPFTPAFPGSAVARLPRLRLAIPGRVEPTGNYRLQAI